MFVDRRVTITKKAIDVTLRVNAVQRPDTLLKGQGDHVTSYTTIIQALLTCAATDMDGAIAAICGFADKMLIDNIDQLYSFNLVREKRPKTHEHDDRIAVYNKLKKDFRHIAELVNQELKYAKLSMLSDYLADLATSLLQGLQKNEFTTIFSDGRQKSSAEGTTTKTAAHALAAFNQLCRWGNKPTEFFDEERVEKILSALSPASRSDTNDIDEQHILRYGISALCAQPPQKTDNGTTAQRIQRSIKSVKNNPNLIKDILTTIRTQVTNLDKIAAFVGDLYDYRRVLIFELSKAFPLTSEIKEEEKKIYWLKQLQDKFNQYDYELEITGTKASVTRINIDQLSETISRHINIITAAFPDLVKVLGEKNLIKKFVSHTVLTHQGWSQHTKANEEALGLADLIGSTTPDPPPAARFPHDHV